MSHAAHIMQRVAKNLTRVLLVTATLFLLVFAVGPQFDTYRTLSVLSDSMKPSFSRGDAIIVVPAKRASVRAGDVITYNSPVNGETITHRVHKVLEGGSDPLIQTKGDANTSVDSWTTRLSGGPLWRHRATVPYAGHVIVAMRRPIIMESVIWLLPLMIVLFGLWEIWRPAKNQQDRPRAELDSAVGISVPA